MQKILFPMDTMNITTGVNMMSHIGGNAIDCAGRDTGIDNVYAPFTGVIKKIWPNGNTVWLESLEPVEFADGSVDFAVCSFTHDNNISDIRVGQIIQQGQVFYQEGTAGNANGNHLHLEVGRGKFTGTGWYQNAMGNWIINNSIAPWNAFWLSNVKVINGFGYNWKTTTNGEDEMRIANTPEWRSRMNKLHHQLVGNWDMSDAVWNSIVGATVWSVVESWSDHPNADQLTRDQVLGEQARTENWASRPTEVVKEVEVIKEVPFPVETIVEKIIEKEVIKEVVKSDKDRSFGDLLSAAISKLFNR